MSNLMPTEIPAWSRPLRIPESIDITHADPPYAIAGERSSWSLPFTLACDVPSHAILKLQTVGGRNNKGAFDGSIKATRQATGDALETIPETPHGTFRLSLPANGLKQGETVTILLSEARSPKIRQLNKFFVLYALIPDDDPSATPAWSGGGVWAGAASERIVAACTLHVLGGTIHHLRAFGPASAAPGETLRILVRPEDALDNLAHERPGDLAVFNGSDRLACRFEPVPDSTCVEGHIVLPTTGTYRLRVVETATGREVLSPPICCGSGSMKRYWGMIHGHTEMSDGTGTLNQYFHQLKNEMALNFAAPGDHDHRWETPDDFWATTCAAVKRWNDPGRFTTFLGYEWAKWRKNGDGDRNVYYLADDRPIYRSDDGDHPSPPDLFAVLERNAEQALVIPHHTGHGGNFCDWKDHDPKRERLVEIFQLRGSYECSADDGNPVPEPNSGTPPFDGGYVRNALALGWRVGFTAGGDDHDGRWGSEACFEHGYKQGLMCVEARDESREAIFAAMHDRRVVATTGARMLLSYQINGQPMGSELSVTAIPGLAAGRTLTIEFHGTGDADRIDIIRNNAVIHTVDAAGQSDLAVTWDDRDAMDAIWLPAAKFCAHPFVFYYVRVVQRDGEVAWASPIWIDP